MSRFAELMFTPAVQEEQQRHGSRAAYARMQSPDAPAKDRLGPAEAAFIAARDSFYMATVTETGWPYIQHRGGAPGFLRVLGERTLGFADFSGNKQYLSVGNLKNNDRVALFLMDYPNQRRLKILGHARAADLPGLAVPGYRGRVERGIIIEIEGFDWNCPQHITPRYTVAELRQLAGGNAGNHSSRSEEHESK